MQPENKSMNAAKSKQSLTHLDLSITGTNSNEIVVAELKH